MSDSETVRPKREAASKADSEAGKTLAEAMSPEAMGLGYREEQTMAQLVWRAFRRHKPAMIGSVVVLLFVLAAVFAPYLSSYDPEKINLDRMLEPPSAVVRRLSASRLFPSESSRFWYISQLSFSLSETLSVT